MESLIAALRAERTGLLVRHQTELNVWLAKTSALLDDANLSDEDRAAALAAITAEEN